MGDPLSIAAGVIAVLGAARKVSQGLGLLKAAKDAPEGLENLLSRVSSIESVLEAIEKTSMDPENLSPGMLKVLDMTKNKFTEMEALLEYSLTQAGTSSKVDRWQWMRRRGQAGKLLNQLDELRTDLIAHVGVQTS